MGYEMALRGPAGFEGLFNGSFKKIYVGYLPGRKSVCLSLITDGGSVYDTVAYFRDQDSAERFLEHFAGQRYSLTPEEDDTANKHEEAAHNWDAQGVNGYEL